MERPISELSMFIKLSLKNNFLEAKLTLTRVFQFFFCNRRIPREMDSDEMSVVSFLML